MTRKIATQHYHGKELPISAVLHGFAGQENNDGDEGNTMQAAGDYITELETALKHVASGVKILEPEYYKRCWGNYPVIGEVMGEEWTPE
ncbi:hypothetical protein LCGC14_0231280 [marine sediment metagenome]|uniref:Uncharacterized protein n=1 Tax=marine sediment metagenome TaxID=412755 RepID=A0A0F9WUI9_9ZZZZ